MFRGLTGDDCIGKIFSLGKTFKVLKQQERIIILSMRGKLSS
jgi:hypothetical protein